MAVPEQTPYSEHIGNGITTSFALGFQCESKDHLIVLVDDVEPPIATWSLSEGNVVFTTAPADGQKITLQRNTPFSRTVDYQSYNNSFRPPAVNKDFDWIWLKLQELGVADWILSNRIDALKNYVDLQDGKLQTNINNLKNYVDDKDDELRGYLLEEIRKQGVALDQLDDYYNYLMQRLAQIAVDKGWDASFVTYQGITQEKINDGLGSILEMLSIQVPKNGMRVFVKGLQGGWFEYNSSKAALNDGGTVFNGWVRIHYLYKCVNLSWFGATPDNAAVAASNEAALLKAVSVASVIVDGYFYCTQTNQNIITKPFVLVGENLECGINFTTMRGSWLRLKAATKFSIDKLIIRAPINSVGGMVTTDTDVDLMDEFNLTDCDIDIGRANLFYRLYSNTIDPGVTLYGIKKLIIERNKASNVAALFVGTNMPYELASIKSNRVKNISNQVVSLGRNNTHLFQRNLQKLMQRLEIAFNTVINDDDYFPATVSNYMCFVLTEGEYVEYYNNHVEGLKTTEKVALYDLYCNARELHYYRNTWKNNICINSTKEVADLMKSKGTVVSFYKNNRFIVEKSFLERHNALDSSKSWVRLFQKTYGDDTSNMVIHDNIIDVYEFLGMPATGLTKNVDIRRNHFKANNCSSIFLNINNTAEDIATYADASAIIYDNDFEFENAGRDIIQAGAVLKGFSLLGMGYSSTSGKGTYREISCTNNRIFIKNLYNSFRIAGAMYAKELNLGDNTISVDNNIAGALYRPLFGVAPVKSNITRNVFSGAMNSDALAVTFNLNSPANLEVELNSPYAEWYSYLIPPETGESTVLVEIRAASKAGLFSGTYLIKVGQTGVAYTDSAGVAQVMPYTDSATIVHSSPKVFPLNPVESLLAGVRFGVRNKENAQGAVRLEYRSTTFTAGQDVKFNISVKSSI